MRRRAVLISALLAAACGYRTDVPEARIAGEGAHISLLVQARDERRARQLRDYLDIALGSAGLAPRIAAVALRLEVVTQELAIRRDETPSRARLSASVQYVATRRAAPGAEPPPLRGTVRVTEGYNFVDTQFFATEASREAAEGRLMEQAAAEIARRLQATSATAS